MNDVKDTVIVTAGATAHGVCVHHHDFPEVRAEGQSTKEAAALLGNRLAAAMDTALTDWRRQSLTKAITDVSEYCKREG
ncbi:hypothetical protein [Paludisphaera mucosa]|uniref:Uncharacterized protein n=1 Tax=Paludisphaera mucosa TaxID=3030827 RepID=A0ABT6FE02_9BACT|nr:hypothetical protein [Paludisphaera mucosa]MDG3005704.1 hypothetical protein [Paludisphaera mucosa]